MRPDRPRARARLVCAALVAACASPPAAPETTGASPAPVPAPVAPGAQPPTAQVAQLYELVVRYPAPVWANTPEAARRSRFRREQRGPEFTLEQIPEDEAFAAWTRLYAVHAWYARDARLDDFVAASVDRWLETCGEEHLALQLLLEQTLHWSALVFCKRTPGGAAAEGWGADVGALTLVDARRMSDTYVRIHHTWRGPRFALDDPGSWPASETALREMMERFATIQLRYAPDAGLEATIDGDAEP